MTEKRPILRWSATILMAVVLLLAVAALGGWLFLRSAEQGRSGTHAVAGLRAPADVLWTEHGVPHVFAGGLEDAVRAQGFIHARDRLFQMELVRRAIQGRLSEVMGEAALGTDRFMRRVGLWEAAQLAVDSLRPAERQLLQAYADGVNQAVERWEGALPPEFLVLGYEPEPWRPVHTLAVAKMMSLTLAAYGESVAVARALRRLPEDRVRWLFPQFPDWGATILGHGVPPEPAETPALAASLIDRFSVAAASNGWVVGGSRTASGDPIVANDMHLELNAPSIWYLMGLHAPGSDAWVGLDVVGVTLPGAPLVIVGRNRAVAWGFTNAYVDDVDLFMERVDPADPDRYLTPDGSRPFQVRAETIAVKGWDEPEVMEVRETRHGPLIDLGGDASGDTLLALAWTAHRSSTVIQAVIGFNLARGADEFVRAADLFDDPHQNIVYADTSGTIGYVMTGTVPIRGDRRPAPVAPRPGWTGEWDWTGELPFSEHPAARDPADGFVATANNRQTVEPVSELISQTWQQPFRAMRISEMIQEADAPLDPDAVLDMQLDVYDLYAERYLDRAVEAARRSGFDDAARLLQGWDRRASPESRAAPVFYAWNEIVRRTLARDLYRGAPSFFTRESAAAVLERRAVPWADDPEARFREIADSAMAAAVEVAAGRAWSESNHVVQTHALGDVRILDAILGLNIGPVPHQGSPTTVNVAHWAFQSPDDPFPFRTTSGVSMRQVSRLGNSQPSGGFVIPTGQSGLPLSRRYDDQLRLWQQGRLLDLSLERSVIEGAATHRMRLESEGQDDGS